MFRIMVALEPNPLPSGLDRYANERTLCSFTIQTSRVSVLVSRLVKCVNAFQHFKVLQLVKAIRWHHNM